MQAEQQDWLLGISNDLGVHASLNRVMSGVSTTMKPKSREVNAMHMFAGSHADIRGEAAGGMCA